ncbi:MAG: hypothetical protein ACYDHU_09715 [Acidimicrobiales bacterium]
MPSSPPPPAPSSDATLLGHEGRTEQEFFDLSPLPVNRSAVALYLGLMVSDLVLVVSDQTVPAEDLFERHRPG